MTKIFADLFAGAKSFDASDSHQGVSRAIASELKSMRDFLGDPDYPAALAGGSNEVQVVHQYASNPATPATYVLTFNLRNGVTFSTAAIAFGANAATVQTAVNTGATGVVPGYTNGDIAVTGTALNSGNLTITFSGDSVSGEGQSLTVITLTVPNLATSSATTTTAGDVSHDEVQHIVRYANNPTGGTFTLTITTNGKSPVTTAGIAYNAAHAVVQAAINTAMTASANKPSGWTNDDIVVSGGDLTSADLVLTFSGTSVTNTDQGQTTINGAGLTTSTAYLAGTPVTTSTQGSTNRPAIAVLQLAGIIGGTIPNQGEGPSGATNAGGFTLGVNPNRLTPDTIRALCVQAEIEDGRDGLAAELLALIGIAA